MLVGAGAAEGAVDAANILSRPSPAANCRPSAPPPWTTIASTSSATPPWSGASSPLSSRSPSVEETVEILMGIKGQYEAHHKLAISDEAVAAARPRCPPRYISDRALPDKAIDLIDESASRVRIRRSYTPPSLKEAMVGLESIRKEKEAAINSQQYEYAAAELRDRELKLQERIETLEKDLDQERGDDEAVVGGEDIAEVVSMWTGIPLVQIATEESQRLLHMEEAIHDRVVGQEEPIKALAKGRASRPAPAPQGSAPAPSASSCFLGPTGVGKDRTRARPCPSSCSAPTRTWCASTCRSSWSDTPSPGSSAPPPGVHHVNWGPEDVDKGGYAHFLLKEIHEQPRVLRDTLAGRITPDGRVTLDLDLDRHPSPEELFFLGCGSASHAAMVGETFFASLTDTRVQALEASEAVRPKHRGPGAWSVLVSQSGETADTVDAARDARRAGHFTLALTNVPESSITRTAHATHHLRAGQEISVASSKTYLAQLAGLYLLGLALYPPAERPRRKLAAALRKLPEAVQQALAMSPQLEQLGTRLASAEHAFIIGKGINYPTALEGALKFKEVAYLHAEGYASGELKHGPFALLGPDTPVIAIMPRDDTYDRMLVAVEEVHSRGAPIIALHRLRQRRAPEHRPVRRLPAAHGADVHARRRHGRPPAHGLLLRPRQGLPHRPPPQPRQERHRPLGGRLHPGGGRDPGAGHPGEVLPRQ